MTEHLAIDDKTIAYDLIGEGPLVVLAHGIGDSRHSYRFIAPALVAAGYRVANVDIRGCGESSLGWDGYSRTDIGGDLVALVRHLGGPGRHHRPVDQRRRGDDRRRHRARRDQRCHRAGSLHARAVVRPGRSDAGQALPLRLHADGDGDRPRTPDKLEEVPRRRLPDQARRLVGRVGADRGRTSANPAGWRPCRPCARPSPVDAGAQLGHVTCPVLIVEGSLDPDWADPRAEGEKIVADLPTGLGELAVIDGAGHYPHAQAPDEVLALALPFLARTLTGA